jgi:hypothetical protein
LVKGDVTDTPHGVTQPEDNKLLHQTEILKPHCHNNTNNVEKFQCLKITMHAGYLLMLKHNIQQGTRMQPTRKGVESEHTRVLLKIYINTLSFKMENKNLQPQPTGKKIMNDETTNTQYTIKN